MKTFLIEIYLNENITKSDLDLRYFLVDTIECRNIGEVVEETSSLTVLEIVIETTKGNKIKVELQNLLISLGFNDYKIQDISNNK